MLKYAGLGLAAAVAGGTLSVYLSKDPDSTGSLRSARFTDLAGTVRTLKEWQDKLLLVNFWATWCPPCVEEIPALGLVRDKLVESGVEFVGIAVDRADKVADFVAKMRISYPILIGGASTVDLIRKLGNPSGALPFTIVVDAKGRIGYKHVGAVAQKAIEDQLGSLLRG